MELLSQHPQISNDLETRGFDFAAGKSWIYPENYPVRDYQFDIVQAALYSNTLVCLPTGLGKTFIAAVVMYNYWRWFPRGKVVFLAPTKPLVAQQIHACHNVMGIPSSETIELTGAINQQRRETAWLKKRVIFATPQVFQNDLDKNIVPSDLVKCVVVDEAHKALGKHSYCECIKKLSERNQYFRILALSATPGNKIDNVHEVLQNLHIAHLELRDDTSPDIVPYINERKLDVILVPLSAELSKYKERYIIIMDRHVKVLLQHKVLQVHTADISKGRVFHLLKEFQNKTNRSGNYGQIIKTLNILMTMSHAYDLMIRDGLRAFLKFFQNHSDKFWMGSEHQLQELLVDIEEYLGPFPETKSLVDCSVANIPENLVFGHTKFNKLQELLLHHFTGAGNSKTDNDTRAIVFVEYRDIVNEIYVLLLKSRPLIRPQMFVGQAGQKQKEQIKALENFRNNHVNVLISTSIGEEGLDVGEVDLIICFDISQHSPTRLVQRMGRTGRKRDGHIIILVTDGKEHQTLKSTMARRDSINNKILNSSNIFSSFYQDNPRMIPDIFKPDCHKMHISVQPKTPITVVRGKNKAEKRKKGKQQTANTKCLAGTAGNALPSKDRTQRSVAKFFQSDKQDQQDDIPEIATAAPRTQFNTKIVNTIEKSDVQILSCDNDALEFLTACTLMKSEKEANVKNREDNVNITYIPQAFPVENFFDFSIPDIQILDCLSTLSPKASSKEKDVLLSNEDDDNANVSDSNVSLFNKPIFTNPANQGTWQSIPKESRFEDLLDDSSSESNGSGVTNCTKENLLSANVSAFKDLEGEPGMFEEIMDESSDSSENSANWIEAKTNYELNRGTLLEEQEKTKNQTESPTKFILDNDENMFTVTQALGEIARINSTKEVEEEESRKMDVESEDDIFLDEAWEHVINEKKTDNTEKPFSLANVTEEEFKIEDDEWEINDDFEKSILGENTTSSPLQSPSYEIKKYEVQRIVDNNIRGDRASLQESPNSSKMTKPTTSIARKAAKLRTSFLADELDDSGDDVVRNLHDISDPIETESWYFCGKSNSAVKKGTTSDRENGAEESFAPKKYFNGKNKKLKTRKKNKNEFICEEAECSASDSTTDSFESSILAADLADFVSYTQNVQDNVDMKAHYLQSIKSPIKTVPRASLFKQPRSPDRNVDVYSQCVSFAEESYINDSFCVIDEEEEDRVFSQIDELSVLETAERALETKKRKGKRYNEWEDNVKQRSTKRQRCMKMDTSFSSEDETEKLRKEIQEESLLLARSRPQS